MYNTTNFITGAIQRGYIRKWDTKRMNKDLYIKGLSWNIGVCL